MNHLVPHSLRLSAALIRCFRRGAVLRNEIGKVVAKEHEHAVRLGDVLAPALFVSAPARSFAPAQHGVDSFGQGNADGGEIAPRGFFGGMITIGNEEYRDAARLRRRDKLHGAGYGGGLIALLPLAPGPAGKARMATRHLTLESAGVDHGFIDIHDDGGRQVAKVFFLRRKGAPMSIGECPFQVRLS